MEWFADFSSLESEIWSWWPNEESTGRSTPFLRELGGGRSWWAHLEFTRMNIALTMVKKDFEETPLFRIRCDYLDLRAFQGRIASARVESGWRPTFEWALRRRRKGRLTHLRICAIVDIEVQTDGDSTTAEGAAKH